MVHDRKSAEKTTPKSETTPAITMTPPLSCVWFAFCALSVPVPDELLRVPAAPLPEAASVCEAELTALPDGVTVASAANSDALWKGTQLLDAGTLG